MGGPDRQDAEPQHRSLHQAPGTPYRTPTASGGASGLKHSRTEQPGTARLHTHLSRRNRARAKPPNYGLARRCPSLPRLPYEALLKVLYQEGT